MLQPWVLGLIFGIIMLIVDALLIIMRLTRHEHVIEVADKARRGQPLGVEVAVRQSALFDSVAKLVPANADKFSSASSGTSTAGSADVVSNNPLATAVSAATSDRADIVSIGATASPSGSGGVRRRNKRVGES